MFILYIPKVQRIRTFTTTTQRFHPVLYRVIAVGNKTNGLTIDILGPRLPTHTWHGRHMHEDSRWRRQPGKNIRNSITNYRFLGFFDGLTASNPLPLDFFENRPLLRRF